MTTVTLKPHQREAVDKLSNGKILFGGVGVGKSITAAAYYLEKEAPKDIYVITTAKKRDDMDWQKEFVKYGISHDNTTTGSLTVDSWNNIGKYTGVHGAFFIFDEQRLVGSGTWVKAFLHIAKSNRWIMLSATPGDTWLDYIPVFVANGFYKNRTAFKQEHVEYEPFSKYPKVKRYHDVGKLVKHRNSLLVKMHYKRHTTREAQVIKCEYDRDLFKEVVEKRWHVYENRPLKNVAELFYVMRRVVNSDSSRLQTLTRLMQSHPKVIVFYNFDYELELLRTLVPEGQLASPESLEDLKRKLASSPHESTSRRSSDSRSSTGSGTGFRSSSSGTTHLASETSSLEFESKGESTTQTTSSSSFGTRWEENCRQLRENGEIRLGVIPDTTAHATPTEIIHASSALQSDVRFSQISASDSTMLSERADSRKSHPQFSQISEKAERIETSSSPTPGDGATSVQTDQSGSCHTKADLVQVAEWNGHKHEPIPKSDRWVYLVQYAAGAEGWNCIETDAMVFFSLTYSYKHFHQAHGRIDRLNTPFERLKYYYLKSESMIDRAVWKSLGQKKSFNEADFFQKS